LADSMLPKLKLCRKSKRPPRKMAFIYLAPRPGLEPGTCGLTVQVTVEIFGRKSKKP